MWRQYAKTNRWRVVFVLGGISVAVFITSVVIGIIFQEISAYLGYPLNALRSGVIVTNAILTTILTLGLVILYYRMSDTQKEQLKLSERINSPQLAIPDMEFSEEALNKDIVGKDIVYIQIANHGGSSASNLHIRVDASLAIEGDVYDFVEGNEIPIDGGVEIQPHSSPLREVKGGDLGVDSLRSGGIIGPSDENTFRSELMFGIDGRGISVTDLLKKLREQSPGLFRYVISIVYLDEEENVQVKPFLGSHSNLNHSHRVEEQKTESFAQFVTSQSPSVNSMFSSSEAEKIKERVDKENYLNISLDL